MAAPAATETAAGVECPFDLTGCYIDNWGEIVLVEHRGKEATVNYGNKVSTASIDNDIIKVACFKATAAVDGEGNVKFSDSGFWQKQAVCKGCHDLRGKFVDNHKNEIVVTQDGYRIVVDYAGTKKIGFIGGNKTGCSGTVRVASFWSSGVMHPDGSVNFGDGGWWKRKSDSVDEGKKADKQVVDESNTADKLVNNEHIDQVSSGHPCDTEGHDISTKAAEENAEIEACADGKTQENSGNDPHEASTVMDSPSEQTVGQEDLSQGTVPASEKESEDQSLSNGHLGLTKAVINRAKPPPEPPAFSQLKLKSVKSKSSTENQESAKTAPSKSNFGIQLKSVNTPGK